MSGRYMELMGQMERDGREKLYEAQAAILEKMLLDSQKFTEAQEHIWHSVLLNLFDDNDGAENLFIRIANTYMAVKYYHGQLGES